MNDETKPFGLASRELGTAAPVLTGVRANGRLDGVLFDLTLRQTYRNTSDSVLEVIYTVGADPNLSHRADSILSQGRRPAF